MHSCCMRWPHAINAAGLATICSDRGTLVALMCHNMDFQHDFSDSNRKFVSEHLIWCFTLLEWRWLAQRGRERHTVKARDVERHHWYSRDMRLDRRRIRRSKWLREIAHTMMMRGKQHGGTPKAETTMMSGQVSERPPNLCSNIPRVNIHDNEETCELCIQFSWQETRSSPDNISYPGQ